MAETGEPYPLVSGNGYVYGQWVIEEITEDQSIFYPDGTPRRVEFSLRIKRVDDNRVDQLAMLTGGGGTGVLV